MSSKHDTRGVFPYGGGLSGPAGIYPGDETCQNLFQVVKLENLVMLDGKWPSCAAPMLSR